VLQVSPFSEQFQTGFGLALKMRMLIPDQNTCGHLSLAQRSRGENEIILDNEDSG
jgi:hypothetical protein